MTRRLLTLGCVLGSTIALQATEGPARSYGSSSHHAPGVSCPATDQSVAYSPGLSSGAPLIAGRPGTLVLCRYDGLDNLRPDALADRKRVKRMRRINQIRTALNALPAPDPGPASCPFDDNTKVLALFGYGHRPSLVISIALDGCTIVNNGQRTAWAIFASGLIREIKTLTRCRAGEGIPACRDD